MKKFQIIVEGDADIKFFEDYYHHLFHEKAPADSITLPIKGDTTGGYKKLFRLQQQGKGEAVVVEDNKHLIVDNKSYSIELHKFSPIEETDAQILAYQKDGQYVFKDTENKQYIWVAELKEMFAQHIVSAYASQLSRVGIDNSEWIRLVGKTN